MNRNVLRRVQDRLTRRVGRNVETTAALRANLERQGDIHTRALSSLNHGLGRPGVLYGLSTLVALWMVLNWLASRHGFAAPDPAPFNQLELAVSLLALFTTLVVLIGQNHQAHLAEHRSELELQVNLLAEQRTAKLVALLEELRRDLPNVRNRRDAEAEDLAQAADPYALASEVKEALEDATHVSRFGGTAPLEEEPH